MSQCAIHRLREDGDLVCRVQADLGVETPDILCAPVVLRSEWGALVPRLHFQVAVGEDASVVLMSKLVALPRGEPGIVVGDARRLGAISSRQSISSSPASDLQRHPSR